MYVIEFVRYVVQFFKQHMYAVVTFITLHTILKPHIYAISSPCICSLKNPTTHRFFSTPWIFQYALAQGVLKNQYVVGFIKVILDIAHTAAGTIPT